MSSTCFVLVRGGCVAQPYSTDTTPLLDPLRTTELHPPYYGVQALEHMSTTIAFDANGRGALLARAREKELELQAMYALLNAGAPINRLPVELLVEIFSHIQGMDLSRAFYWTDILRVCRHWFVAGSTAAKLWKNLKVTGSTNLLRTGLARSRGAEVTIEMMNLFTHPLPEAAPFVAPHLHRVRCLRLWKIPLDTIPALVQFMDNDMPALRCFFAHIDPQAAELIFDFSPARFPRLEELRVSRIHIFGDLSVFAQLRILSLTGCVRSTPMLKTATFLDALRRMENIEELVLSNIRVCDLGSASPFAGADSVVLSKLQKFGVTHTEGPLIKQLLSTITLPASATISLSAPLQGETLSGNTANINAFLPKDRRCLPILTTIVEAHIVMFSDVHSVEGYTTSPAPITNDGASLDFRLDVPDDGFGDDLNVGPEDVIEVLRDSPLEYVTIEVSSAVVSQVNWRDFFAANPTLRVLDLVISEDTLLVSFDVIFSALDPGDATAPAAHGAGADAGPSVDMVLCPKLRSLRLYGLSATPATLLDTVAASLENRRRMLGKPSEHALDDLVLGLVDHPDELAFQEQHLAFSERLAPLVGVLDFHTGEASW